MEVIRNMNSSNSTFVIQSRCFDSEGMCIQGNISEENIENGRCLRHKRKKETYAPLSHSFQKNIANGLKNGRWALDEHKRFIQAVFKYGNDWKKIQKDIQTRSCAQARSHSQKFFSKLLKLGIEGITEDMTDLRYLHDLYLSSDKDKIDVLMNLLAEVAHSRLENEDNVCALKIEILQNEESFDANEEKSFNQSMSKPVSTSNLSSLSNLSINKQIPFLIEKVSKNLSIVSHEDKSK